MDYNTEVKTIENYLQHIKCYYNVSINFNDIVGIGYTDENLRHVLNNYHYHNNCFCNFLKKNNGTLKNCTMKKLKLSAHCSKVTTPFYGKCYMGIEEFIFPIIYNNKLIAYFCVGEFSKDKDRTKRIIKRNAKRYDFDANEALERLDLMIRDIDFDVDKLYADMNVVSNYIALYYKSYLQGLIIDNKDCSNSHNNHTKNHIIDTTIKFINDNYSSKLTLQLLASNSYCNPTYLSHIFKKHLGTNITDYINQVRIKKSKYLLDATNMSIVDIALSVGYNNSSYFCKVFKQSESINPNKYRLNKID